MLPDDLRPHLAELLPVVRRVAGLDAGALVRLRVDASVGGDAGGATISVYATLPFKVLVSRTVAVRANLSTHDSTYAASEALTWLEHDGPQPVTRDADWRGGLPPRSGWRRLDRVPDDVIRPLIRAGALALKEAAAREGVPGAEPRASVSDALLDSVVLTVSADASHAGEVGEGGAARPVGGAAAGTGQHTVGITLRLISSLVRMGFVPRGSTVAIDVARRWTRVSGEYGSAYAEAPGGLTLR
jgi:hypothetical protein